MSGSVTLGWSALLKPEGLSSCVSADMHLSKYETGVQFTQREREREREIGSGEMRKKLKRDTTGKCGDGKQLM